MTPSERLAEIRRLWRQLRPWIEDQADRREGSEDTWAWLTVEQLDHLLSETPFPGPDDR